MFNSSAQKAEAGKSEFEVYLVYRVSSRQLRLQRETLSQNKEKQTNKQSRMELTLIVSPSFRLDRREYSKGPSGEEDWFCVAGWSQTHRDLPASTSRVLGLKACATTPGL